MVSMVWAVRRTEREIQRAMAMASPAERRTMPPPRTTASHWVPAACDRASAPAAV